MRTACGRIALLALAIWLQGVSVRAGRFERREHDLGDEAPLVVYALEGDRPGPRVLVIAGIHGDEPGGYLAADELIEGMDVRRGSVLLVPRANFPSIVRNQRGVRGDMNRRFLSEDSGDGVDARVVDLLKGQLGQVDALLNLHDGAGFYSPERKDELRNPGRFGQSVVIDAEVFLGPRGPIPLGQIARRAVERANALISDGAFHLHVKNTRTLDKDSPHPEMRSSATFYALQRYGIPAFGIETSKDLPTLELRLRHQFFAVTSILVELGLELDIPAIRVEPPALDFAVVRVDRGEPRLLLPGAVLQVREGALVEIVEARANRLHGLTADISGAGGWNDLGREVPVRGPAQIVFRSDSEECGRIRVEIRNDEKPRGLRASRTEHPVEMLPVEVNAAQTTVRADTIIEVIAGDTVSFAAPGRGTAVRLHGFPGGTAVDPQDDTGYLVDTGRDLLGEFSVGGEGEYYRVDAVSASRRDVLATVFLRVRPVEVRSLVIERNGEAVRLSPSSVTEVRKSDVLRIGSLESNVKGDGELQVNLKGFRGGPEGEDRGMSVRPGSDLDPAWAVDTDRSLYEIVVTRRDLPVARFYLRVAPGGQPTPGS